MTLLYRKVSTEGKAYTVLQHLFTKLVSGGDVISIEG